jgi:starvation-inducible DNA-binding protein
MPTKTNNKSASTKIDIKKATRDEVIDSLNSHLAMASDLYSQTKQAHWNVRGRDFMQLHLLFDKVAEPIQGFADMIAERIAALGGVPMGTVRMAAKSSQLAEFPAGRLEGMKCVRLVAERFGSFGNSTRDAIDAAEEAGDMATSDLYTEITREVDLSIYFLQSHLD